MHKTHAPGYRGGGKIVATVLRSTANTDQGEVEVISVEMGSHPTLLIEKSGEGRLVQQRKGRSSHSNAMTYASPKVFTIDNPFEQPVSAILLMYEQALQTL